MTSANPRILIVDDDANLLLGLVRNYRKNFAIMTAESGSEGLTILKDYGPFAVVVADLNMPGMDGSEFLEHVRKEAPTTSRVMLTGSDDLEIGESAINSGLVSIYLCKPCPEHAFRDALDLAVDAYHSRRNIEDE